MEADNAKLKQRTYNIAAMSFTPAQIVEEVRKHIPHLKVTYNPDSRQNIGQFLCGFLMR
jgi:threonine 3-dehydrogenase